MMTDYKKLDVTEFKISKHMTSVKWMDDKGDGKSITSVALPSQQLTDAMGELKEILAMHLSLPVDRVQCTGAKYRRADDGTLSFTLTGTLLSYEAGIENAVSCALKYDEDDYLEEYAIWTHEDARKICGALQLAGYYAQGDRRNDEPTFFDADYRETPEAYITQDDEGGD